MPFSVRAQTALEFDKIKKMLADTAATEGARARAMALTPSSDYDTVVTRLGYTSDAKRLINAKGYPSFSAPEATVAASERAYKGAL